MTVDDLVRRSGIDGVTAVEPLSAGQGGNDLWLLRRSAGDLVLRIFPEDAPSELAEREQQAHQHARDHGIAAPQVHRCAVADGRAYLIMDHVPGVRLADALWAGADPDDLGRRSGATLAALHAIADPAPMLIAARSWLSWKGQLSEFGPRLTSYDSGRVALHLDFHPENLIIAPDGTVVVLDWANCVVGPPQADLARTLSILHLIMVAVPEMTEVTRRIVDRYRDGLLAGYREAGGDPDVPDPIQGWAYAVQREDMADSWVPSWYLDQLDTLARDLLR